jgi:protein-serine/threonine kinase
MANNNDNRFYLNINNDRPAYNDRAYPTTPSTFPNPIFPPQGQQAQQQQPQQASNQQYGNQFAPAGYFQNQQYPSNYPQQPPTTYQPSSHAVPQQQNTYQPRVNPNQADATNGLVHQFSHQNLGGASRQQQYSSRPGGGGSQRPRTAGAQGQQHSYNSYLNAPMPSHPSQQRNWSEFESAPERNPNRYSQAVTVQQKSAINLAETFFKDNVARARDRNVR